MEKSILKRASLIIWLYVEGGGSNRSDIGDCGVACCLRASRASLANLCLRGRSTGGEGPGGSPYMSKVGGGGKLCGGEDMVDCVSTGGSRLGGDRELCGETEGRVSTEWSKLGGDREPCSNSEGGCC